MAIRLTVVVCVQFSCALRNFSLCSFLVLLPKEVRVHCWLVSILSDHLTTHLYSLVGGVVTVSLCCQSSAITLII